MTTKFLKDLQSPKRFKLLKDGWTKDSFTGLDWGVTSASTMTFTQAEKYCKQQGGRLPELHELHSAVNFARHNPCSYEIFKDRKSYWYWSKTRTAWSNSAWCVDFSDGNVGSSLLGYSLSVRPCRPSRKD